MTRAITRSHALGLAVLTDVMRHRLARWDAGGEARCADVFLRSGPSLALRLRLRPFRQPRYTRERAMVEDANEDAGSSAHLGEVALLLLPTLQGSTGTSTGTSTLFGMLEHVLGFVKNFRFGA